MFPAHQRLVLWLTGGFSAILAVSVATAQNRPSVTPPYIVLGTVQAVSSNQVYVQSDLRLAVLNVDALTEIWKGKVVHDLSAVEAGDTIIARCRPGISGNLIAESIRLNGFNSSGVITVVTDTGFQFFTNPNADPQSGYRKETKTVELTADTVFDESAREDLKVGRGVDVNGLDLRNGTVRASRVTVREGNRPVRMGAGRMILPSGQIR